MIYLSGKYWWLGIAAIVLFTLLLFHTLPTHQSAPTQPSTAAVAPAVQKPQAAPALPKHPVLDLFNPSAENISRDQAISRTRSELEQLLVIATLLEQCGHIAATDKQSILNAGQAYAAHTKLFEDEASLLQELLASAEETYALVYATTDCNEESLASLKAQTFAWREQFTSQ